MDAIFRFPCSSCGKWHTCRQTQVGRKAKCSCGAVVVVPAPRPTPEEASPLIPDEAPTLGKRELSLGAAGLVLVFLRLLQFAGGGAKSLGDVLWFVSAVGIFASFVGLVMCVVALFKGSGRAAAGVGLAVYVLLAVVFMGMK